MPLFEYQNVETGEIREEICKSRETCPLTIKIDGNIWKLVEVSRPARTPHNWSSWNK